MDRPNLDVRLQQVAVLGDPVRLALYRFVAASNDAVSREEAATGVGVAHHVAKFHLDRLVKDGLLGFEYRRPPGRGGPGAGRPTKLYRRGDAQVDVSLPERRYQLAGEMLVDAIGANRDVREVAAEAGRDIGSAARRTRSTRGAVVELLTEHGYEPCADGSDIVLANCPFHALAHKDRELVCGMNLAFVDGVVGGLGAKTFRAVLDPDESRCCVRLVRARASKAV